MITKTAKETARERKEAAARQRACFDEEMTHLRAGDWQGQPEPAVAMVGRCADLHGSVCTCCPTNQSAPPTKETTS